MPRFLLPPGQWDSNPSLTGDEARIIQEEYTRSADHYTDPHCWREEACHQAGGCWDLWDAAVPEGTYDYKPSRDDPDQAAEKKYVRPEELTYLLQYCASPWRNATGVDVVDCDIVLDPSRWGT